MVMNVADDDNAFLRYDVADRTVSSADDRVELVTVTNQLQERIEIVDVVIVGGAGALSDVACSTTVLGPHEETRISAAHNLDPGESVTVGVTVIGEGPSVSVELSGESRLFTVTHEP
jgi:hypothetical protein